MNNRRMYEPMNSVEHDDDAISAWDVLFVAGICIILSSFAAVA